MRLVNPRRLRLVHGKSFNRVPTAQEHIEQAIAALTDESNAIVNPAPLGVWLVRPENKKPQYRWEVGKDSRGRPKSRSKSITLAEASTWERRRAGRERKQQLSLAIERLEAVLFDLR